MNFRLPEKMRFTEAEMARFLDVHVGTIARWRLKGVRSHRLPSYLIGGRRFIDRQDAIEFLTAINTDDSHNRPAERKRHDGELRQVEKVLQQMGL